jgi:hypothetical protein
MYQCKRRRGTEPSLNAEHSVGTGD